MFNILKNCMNFIMIYQFYMREWKSKKSKSLKFTRWNWICHSHEKHEKLKVLNHGLILKKGHRVVKFNKKACLKPYEYWYEY